MALITLTTDFGTTDPYVGIMKGVIAGRAPDARVVDVTHGIPAQDVLAGALVLRHAAPYFPPGTVHVVVVDPGVGTARRALCVETAGAVLVGPDNGVLSLAAGGAVRRIVHLTDRRFFLPDPSATFHGRDVFAPVAAALATGTAPAALGTEVPDMIRLDVPAPSPGPRGIHGQVLYVDGFGNLVTNVPHDRLPGRHDFASFDVVRRRGGGRTGGGRRQLGPAGGRRARRVGACHTRRPRRRPRRRRAALTWTAHRRTPGLLRGWSRHRGVAC
jgi:S-adenosyl-L-methionine hydrolase (adenosine-forming)